MRGTLTGVLGMPVILTTRAPEVWDSSIRSAEPRRSSVKSSGSAIGLQLRDYGVLAERLGCNGAGMRW